MLDLSRAFYLRYRTLYGRVGDHDFATDLGGLFRLDLGIGFGGLHTFVQSLIDQYVVHIERKLHCSGGEWLHRSKLDHVLYRDPAVRVGL